jgi:preprotein translocase subunit SecG
MFVLGILAVLVAAALIFVVVIQNSKGGGLSSTFGGGATQIMGARRSNEFIEKVTWYLAGALGVIAFLANIISSNPTEAAKIRMMRNIEEQIIEDPVALPDAAQYESLPENAAPEEGE